MKKNKKRLKLTKLTVANLDRVKGGIDHCACDIGTNNGALNQLHPTVISCIICINP